MRCEAIGLWGKELLIILVRLPKIDGGSRLIGIMDSLVRVWGRAWRGVSSVWESVHRCQEIWGTGQGMSSSDAAYAHNLAAEMSHLVGEHSLTVMIDLWKCCETIPPVKLLEQAQLLGFPLRLVWMCVQSYYQR